MAQTSSIPAGGLRGPVIIQGGMGVAVSGWRLARAVSSRGQLGVVSGTALDIVLARRLQLGDPGGELRRAIACFPEPSVAKRVLDAYFVPGGIAAGQAFASVPVYTSASSPRRHELAVVGGFVEVFLAREGHEGPVGINFLEKIQVPTPATLYGALLAGVGYVLVGAGIPREIPRLLDALCRHEAVTLPLHVTGEATNGHAELRFDPAAVLPSPPPPPARPRFLPIIASATLGVSLLRHSPGGIDGFVVEGPTAGGHNAPPRGNPALSPDGEPVYGPRDVVDLERLRGLGLPFWLAGAYASPGQIERALAAGAAGVQVGTLFAFCEESGMHPDLRREALQAARRADAAVFTDPLASPTGFPFKVARLPGTLSEGDVYAGRKRACDLGYLRETYAKPDGHLGYRCPAEPEEDYVRKGGALETTVGRKCICNGLLATIGLGQRRAGRPEPPIVTAGNDLAELGRMLRNGNESYTAADVLDYLLGHGSCDRDREHPVGLAVSAPS